MIEAIGDTTVGDKWVKAAKKWGIPCFNHGGSEWCWGHNWEYPR